MTASETALAAEGLEMGEVKVGAVVVKPRHAQTVKDALNEHMWHKGKVTPYTVDDGSKLLAFHVTHSGATVLSDPARAFQLPPTLAALLEAGDAQWVPGVRHCSARCLGKPASFSSVTQATPADFRFIELFAGIGGFRVALEALGGACVFASEISEEAKLTYRANFGDTPFGDITQIDASDIPAHDILTAGFPCQSFSSAGNEEGLEGDRGILFFEVTRVLRGCRPRAFILENVPNMLRLEDGEILRTVVRELRACGYSVFFNSMSAGSLVPQARRRLYFVGIRDDVAGEDEIDFQWPCLPVLPRCILDILDRDVDFSLYQLCESQWESIAARTGPDRIQHRLARLEGRARTLMASYRNSSWYSEFVTDPNGGPPRFYTPRECARLMGLPESYRLDADPKNVNRVYHQMGNMVCAPIVAAIGASVLNALNGMQKSSSEVRALALELVLASTAEPHAAMHLREDGLGLAALIKGFEQGNMHGLQVDDGSPSNANERQIRLAIGELQGIEPDPEAADTGDTATPTLLTFAHDLPDSVLPSGLPRGPLLHALYASCRWADASIVGKHVAARNMALMRSVNNGQMLQLALCVLAGALGLVHLPATPGAATELASRAYGGNQPTSDEGTAAAASPYYMDCTAPAARWVQRAAVRFLLYVGKDAACAQLLAGCGAQDLLSLASEQGRTDEVRELSSQALKHLTLAMR